MVANKAKKLIGKLGRRGPHDVDFGDLGFTGVSGRIYVPRIKAGKAPLVAFAHDWTKSSRYYEDTLKHLASWGFIAAATDAGSGIFSSQNKYIDAISDSIEAAVFANLGHGKLRADPRSIGLFGHGLGATAATALASYRTDISAVVAAFPKAASAGTIGRASLISAPGLVISAEKGDEDHEAESLSQIWNGPCILRRADVDENGLVERSALLRKVGLAGGDRKTQQLVRSLATGFLLSELAGDEEYAVFASADAAIPGTTLVDDELIEKEEQKALAKELKKQPFWQSAAVAALKR